MYGYCAHILHHWPVLQMVCALSSISHTSHNRNSTHHCIVSISGNAMPTGINDCL